MKTFYKAVVFFLKFFGVPAEIYLKETVKDLDSFLLPMTVLQKCYRNHFIQQNLD